MRARIGSRDDIKGSPVRCKRPKSAISPSHQQHRVLLGPHEEIIEGMKVIDSALCTVCLY